MKKRVVITGMGVVSPNGIGNEAFCRAVLDGVSGVKRIRSFDPSDLPVQIAGEIQDFDELAWMDARERKHVSRVVPLALAASTEALSDAGLDTSQLSLEQQREIGVVLGSGGGAQEFSEEQVRLWLTGHVKQVSLFCIPSGTMGTLSSEISMRFGLRGMSHVITTGCTSSTDAFGYALRQIQFGFLPMMLVGGVDAPIAPGIMKGFTLMKIMTSVVERRAGARVAAVLARSRRLRGGRGLVDVRAGRVRTRAGARSEDSRRGRGLRFDVRGVSSRAPAGVRRGAGARHPDGDGGCGHSAQRTSTTSTCTARRRSSTIASRRAR